MAPEATTPSVIAPLQRANHGSHFRAYGLRGMAALIDPFLGVDHAWMRAPTFPPHPHAGLSAVSYLFLDSETGKTVHSLQIFVGLARERQDMAPFALRLEPQDVPVVQLPGAKVRVPVGRFGGTGSPLNPPTDVTMLDLSLEAGAELAVPVAAGHCAFVMPIFGTAMVDGLSFGLDDLKLPVFPAQDAPRAITLRAPLGSAKVMLFAGPPLHAAST
ncbi:pirin family protein [Ralstonia solanacearum]|uniref:Pirin family protein n=1 Tax=Ralstonia solanacearum TaxID=305 RepID=A0AAW5ZU90_RALSL|nr:pirin-like C-terminal cupin domain-containing protein [Ralstonia solanacearum]MDB0573351.1 pirin family protein [Ralstonia solanacearum]